MGIEVNSIKCPECGANLPIEEGRERLFCSYCGTPIMLTNDNEQVIRHIDEAEVKQAETDRLIELKKMEMAEKNRLANEKSKKIKTIISIVLGIIAIIGFLRFESTNGMSAMLSLYCLIAIAFMWMMGSHNSNTKEKEDDGRIKVPYDISDFHKKSYISIEAMFKGAGFTNVTCVPLNDLRAGIIKRPNMVEAITVNGESITDGGKKFYPDATVVITYHSLISGES